VQNKALGLWCLVIGIFFLDRLTKYLALKYIPLHESIPVIRNILHLSLVFNKGAAFGIFKGGGIFFIIISLIAIMLIIFSLKRQKENKFFGFALAIILAGALGNLTDRIFLGYVVDFLDFRIWPVFNVADSAITIGTMLLGYSIIKEARW
jgi:signal peptidase II